MNASDDEVFEDMVENLAAEKEGVIENLEVEVHTTTMAPKSATKSMTSYKGFCMKKIKDAKLNG